MVPLHGQVNKVGFSTIDSTCDEANKVVFVDQRNLLLKYGVAYNSHKLIDVLMVKSNLVVSN